MIIVEKEIYQLPTFKNVTSQSYVSNSAQKITAQTSSPERNIVISIKRRVANAVSFHATNFNCNRESVQIIRADP